MVSGIGGIGAWQRAPGRRAVDPSGRVGDRYMGQTKQDLDDISGEADKYMAVIRAVVRPFQPLMRLGFFKNFIARTASGRVGAITRHSARGEHDRAVDIAIELLKQSRHQPASSWRATGHDYWWMDMSFAVYSLNHHDDQAKRDEVMEMARNGVEPFEGYYAAQSFLAFSRWKYDEGDHATALEFAHTAATADAAWAEPNFLLGWYSLVMGTGDALTHFSQAIQKDSQTLPRIMNDPTCQRHPHILHQLKTLSVVDDATDHDGD